jgi:hypothetical protein
MNHHRRFEQMLAARGLLTPDERAQLAAHLAGCPTCRQSAEAFDRQDRFLHTLSLESPPKSVLPAVLASPAAVTRKHERYHRLLTPLGLQGAGLPRRMASLAVLAVLALAILSGAVYAAGSIIRVYHPEDHVSPTNAARLFWIPSLPPYPTVHYRSLDPRTAATQSGYAVAYLRTAPPDIAASVGVDISPHVGWPKQVSGPQPTDPRLRGLAIAIRSVVRYRGSGHTVIVLLNEPSPTAINTQELVLGERTIHLPNGQEAWASAALSSALPFIHSQPGTIPFTGPRSGNVNTLAWVVGHYVVSLWSDLSEARLRQLAAQAVVVPPAARPSQRGIPPTWPTPLPLERLPARLQAAVSGGVTYRRQGTTLTMRYTFDLSSYGQGALYGLDKWHNVSITVLFPPSLQRRTSDPVRRQTFPGGDGGIGGDTTFRVADMGSGPLAQAVRQGVTVHVAWTERGQRRRQSFHFPIIPAGACTHEGPVCAGPGG